MNNEQLTINKSQGYTLVEILVVVSLLGTVGLIIAIVLYSSLRGGEKTNLIERVKQNGNYGLSVFSREARFASVFDGVSLDGTTFTTACVSGTKYQYVRFQDGSGQKNTFSCASSTFSVIRQSAASTSTDTLINGSQVGVVPGSCSFSCSNATSVGTYTVGVSFSLTDPISAAPSTSPRTPLFEKTIVNPVLFETSVTLRNTGN